jgi:hypothetical protein
MKADRKIVNTVIVAGLKLSPNGQALASQSLSEKETENRGKGDNRGIWNQPNIARGEYDYVVR